MTITGVAGSLLWGYHQAGVLGAWTITHTDGVWRLDGAVVSLDPFKASQRPLEFVMTHQHGSWRWPILSQEVAGAQFHAVLGARR